MNALTACAASGLEMDWHGIDWGKCHQQVRRLQARIVKATQEGRWGKVKALQWLLTHSYSGKTIAVKRVTENKGKKTPGVDGKTWSTPDAKMKAVLSLKRNGYKPKPMRRVYIPKTGPVEEPPKVFVLSYVCLNAYKHCFTNRLFLMHHLAWTKIALWLKRAHILFS